MCLVSAFSNHHDYSADFLKLVLRSVNYGDFTSLLVTVSLLFSKPRILNECAASLSEIDEDVCQTSFFLHTMFIHTITVSIHHVFY